MDSVEGCTDPKICERVAAISNEASGILDDFEKAVAQLLPACPVEAKVAKKRKMQTYLDLEEISRLELAPRLVWNFATTSHLHLPRYPTIREKSCWTFARSISSEERAATKKMIDAASGTPTEMAPEKARNLITKESKTKLQL